MSDNFYVRFCQRIEREREREIEKKRQKTVSQLYLPNFCKQSDNRQTPVRGKIKWCKRKQIIYIIYLSLVEERREENG